jgi:hypothetical protein
MLDSFRSAQGMWHVPVFVIQKIIQARHDTLIHQAAPNGDGVNIHGSSAFGDDATPAQTAACRASTLRNLKLR